MENEIASLASLFDQMEERITDIEDRNLETNQKEEERNRRMKNNERETQELVNTIQRGNKNNRHYQRQRKAEGTRKHFQTNSG